MAILVDELREYPGVRLPFSHWCHMATDGEWDELHAFAARLGLRRKWFQGDHYDLPPHGRAEAVALGAQEVPTRELLERMTGPRGERARRRGLAPQGVMWLRGAAGPAVLRYPSGALVVIGGPPGAGKSALVARAVDETRVLLLDPGDAQAPGRAAPPAAAALAATLAAGGGAVAVTRALGAGRGLGLTGAAAAAGVPAHLLLLEDAPPGNGRVENGRFEPLAREWAAFRRGLQAGADASAFASVVIADRVAAGRIRRVTISPRR